jgi:hypothetical protein
MKRFSKLMLLALGFGVLAVSLAVVTDKPVGASSGSAPVNIAQVTVPSVPVSGNVNIANTPSVSVTNTPTISLAAGSAVNVTNPLANNNPIPLATLDASQPYEDTTGFIEFSGGPSVLASFRQVPAGKRLVIQEVDAEVEVPAGLKPIFISMGPSPTASASRSKFLRG